MSRIKDYLRPANLEEALAMLARGAGRTAILGGGTSLALQIPASVDTLLDIADAGLDYITQKDGLVHIGAGVRVASLATSDVCRKLYGGALADAAANIGSTPLRNLITVGGASFQVMPWSDLPGVLLAMDAAFLVKSASGAERMVPAQTLFARQPRTVLSPSELLVEVQIPIPELAHLGAYQKVAKTRVDYAALTVTVTLLMRQDLVVDARVVVGAAKALPTRLQQAEQVLVNQAPNRQLFVKAASIAAGALEPVRDIRYSALYKKHLTKIWVRRCLERALKLTQGGTYAD